MCLTVNPRGCHLLSCTSYIEALRLPKREQSTIIINRVPSVGRPEANKNGRAAILLGRHRLKHVEIKTLGRRSCLIHRLLGA